MKPESVIEPPEKKKPRSPYPIFERRREPYAIIVGILGTILFHLIFFASLPHGVWSLGPLSVPSHHEKDLEIQLAPEEKAPKQKPRFVETNPDKPANPPDKTRNFSNRNEQAANKVKPKKLSPDKTPARKGENKPSHKIVTGDLNPQVLPAPPAQNPKKQEQARKVQRQSMPQEKNPLPGFERETPKSDKGPGSNVAKAAPNELPVPQAVKGVKTKSKDIAPLAISSSPQQAEPSPMPRPRLPQIPPGPIQQQQAGVSQIGQVGYDAKFSQFGDYMERMVEAVSQHWNDLNASRSYSESGTYVKVKFVLTKDGTVKDMQIADATAKALGILLCRSAIAQGAPYGPWTVDMVNVLGDEQTITFTFYYW